MINLHSPQYVSDAAERSARGARQRLDRRVSAADDKDILHNGIAIVMAEVMVDRATASGACTNDDLYAAGFTSSEIASFAEEARRLALRPRRA